MSKFVDVTETASSRTHSWNRPKPFADEATRGVDFISTVGGGWAVGPGSRTAIEIRDRSDITGDPSLEGRP